MDEFTNHQLLLMEIKDKLCDGNAAELARRIGKDATYVNRLFYPKGKAGAKGIGLEIMAACNRAFYLPIGFWDSPAPALDDQLVHVLKARMILRNEAFHEQTPGDKLSPEARRERLHSLVREEETLYAAQEQTERAFHAAREAISHGLTPIRAWEHPDDLPEGDFVMIPRLDVHLSAGNGHDQVEIELTKDNPQAFRTEWIRLMRLKPAKLAAMRASGESMEPTIYDGDSLLVDTSQVDVVDGKVYALWYDGGERVKRLFRLPGGGLRILSDNTRFPAIELGPDHHEQVRIIGRIVHRSSVGGL